MDPISMQPIARFIAVPDLSSPPTPAAFAEIATSLAGAATTAESEAEPEADLGGSHLDPDPARKPHADYPACDPAPAALIFAQPCAAQIAQNQPTSGADGSAPAEPKISLQAERAKPSAVARNALWSGRASAPLVAGFVGPPSREAAAPEDLSEGEGKPAPQTPHPSTELRSTDDSAPHATPPEAPAFVGPSVQTGDDDGESLSAPAAPLGQRRALIETPDIAAPALPAETALSPSMLRTPERSAAETIDRTSRVFETFAHAFENAGQQDFTVVRVARRADGRIELRLDPPDLGWVVVEFDASGQDSVKAVVLAESGDTLDMMRRLSDVLARECARSGLPPLDLEFRHGSAGAFAGRAASHAAIEWERDYAAGEAAPVRVAAPPRTSGLDIRV